MVGENDFLQKRPESEKERCKMRPTKKKRDEAENMKIDQNYECGSEKDQPHKHATIASININNDSNQHNFG